MALAVGIDLGTTNTVVSSVRDGAVHTLKDAQGSPLLPSVVSFPPTGPVLAGRAASERRLTDAPNTIYSVKRLIGRPWNAAEVQRARSQLPFELQEGPKGGTVVIARGSSFSLPEVSAFVLRHAKATAEAALGEVVLHAVVTVPANFNDLQRAATKTACRLADLHVLRILNEPTAAALAYGSGADRERVAIFDLGGGTFDVTILDLVGNVFEVLATAGDTALGGDDIDSIIAGRMADDLLQKYRVDARQIPQGLARLRILGEQLKRELSMRSEHVVKVPALVTGEGSKEAAWQFRMTRSELEQAASPLIERSFEVCRQALDAAGTQPQEIDRVILVGGATRMPLVSRRVEQFFGRPPLVRINPDEVVALGAALQASLLAGSRQRTGPPPIARDSMAPAFAVPDLPLVGLGPPVAPSANEPLSRPPGPPPARVPPRNPPAAVGQQKTLVFDVHEAPTKAGQAIGLENELPPPRTRPAQTAAVPPRTGKPEIALDIELPSEAAFTAQEIELELDVPTPRVESVPPRAAAAQPSAGLPFASTLLHPARPPLLIDVTPLALSVETVGGFADQILEANTPVPCDRTRSFTTATDLQTTVCVRIAQGPSKRFEDNTFLGELELSGIAPAERGAAQIAVTFEIDVDGILNVRAKDAKTGRETRARMNLVGAQTDPADIESMRQRQQAFPLAPVEPLARPPARS